MPVYTFAADDGDSFDEFFNSKEKPDSIIRNGKEYVAQLNFGAFVRVKNGNGGSRPAATWPRVSTALGVAPEQVPEAMENDRRLGVPIEYTKDGDACFSSKGQEKRWCEANGYHQRNAGFGDATPK